MLKAYLLGALHDGTIRKKTYRIGQKNRDYIEFLAREIRNLGYKAWIYKEGKSRNFWIVEFSINVLKGFEIKTQQDKIEYLKGYFDSEGGISKSPHVRYYIYFAQKNHDELEIVQAFLEEFDITCGVIHNPSKKIDPNYWRFFIKKESYEKFAHIIGSDHPEKRRFLRMKI